MALLQKINARYSRAKREKCCENRCRAHISRGIEHLILKGEMLDSKIRMCDCLIFQNRKKIVLVELKGRRFNPEKVKEKFQNSAEKSIEIMAESGQLGKADLRLLLLTSAYKKSSYKIIREMSVPIMGMRLRIETLRCGDIIDAYLE